MYALPGLHQDYVSSPAGWSGWLSADRSEYLQRLPSLHASLQFWRFERRQRSMSQPLSLNIALVGVGGQGTLVAGKLLARCQPPRSGCQSTQKSTHVARGGTSSPCPHGRDRGFTDHRAAQPISSPLLRRAVGPALGLLAQGGGALAGQQFHNPAGHGFHRVAKYPQDIFTNLDHTALGQAKSFSSIPETGRRSRQLPGDQCRHARSHVPPDCDRTGDFCESDRSCFPGKTSRRQPQGIPERI